MRKSYITGFDVLSLMQSVLCVYPQFYGKSVKSTIVKTVPRGIMVETIQNITDVGGYSSELSWQNRTI